MSNLILTTMPSINIIGKYFILNKLNGGLYADISLAQEEYNQMVRALREVIYELFDKIKELQDYFFNDIVNGKTITEENVRPIRSGYGLHPKVLKKIVNEKSSHYI